MRDYVNIPANQVETTEMYFLSAKQTQFLFLPTPINILLMKTNLLIFYPIIMFILLSMITFSLIIGHWNLKHIIDINSARFGKKREKTHIFVALTRKISILPAYNIHIR